MWLNFQKFVSRFGVLTCETCMNEIKSKPRCAACSNWITGS